MDKLLIAADDFTGALDTGIQFTGMGLRTRVVTAPDYDLSQLDPGDNILSVNTDTRPLSANEAYSTVYRLAQNARQAGFGCVYKKTDSGLRGNVGMELKAVMDAYETDLLAFIPALPKLNRITRNGIQYIDGVPVAESVFGKDPFEPVQYSDIEEIIHSQTDLKVVKIAKDAYESADFNQTEKTVLLFDAETEDDLMNIARLLLKNGHKTAIAGCAGFAVTYKELLSFEKSTPHYMQETDGLLALCGSVNNITVQQLQYAEDHGFERIHLTNPQKLGYFGDTEEECKTFFDAINKMTIGTEHFIIDSLDQPGSKGIGAFAEEAGLTFNDIRFRIAGAFGRIALEMVDRNLNYTFSMTGGDTLMGFMNCTGVKELVPVCEIGKGAVLSLLNWKGKTIQVISKSGGFGEENIFVEMLEQIRHPRLKPEKQ